MTERPPLNAHRAVFAAEYALGLLEPDDVARAQRLLNQDPDFAAEVAEWETIVAGWLDEAEDVVPSADLWRRIEAGISHSKVHAHRPLAPAFNGWRAMAMVASIAAVVFCALWVSKAGAPPRQATVATAPVSLQGLSFAKIDDKGDEQLVIAAYDRQTGRFMARLSPLATQGRVPELWVIGGDGNPKSLGIGQPGQVISIVLPPDGRQLFANGATIAISLEAPSDRLHDGPSGPILGTATISGI